MPKDITPASAAHNDEHHSPDLDRIAAMAIGEQPAMLSNLAFGNLVNNVNMSQQNAVANQQAMNQIGVSVTGKVVNMITTLGPLEAVSANKVLTGNDLAQEIADLKAALEAFGSSNAAATDGQQVGNG